jgi:hypothetical protein
LAKDWKARTKAATVHLPETGGRGALIPGGLVVTATHCIGWDGTAGLTLGDHHPVRVKAGRRIFRLGPWYADAVSDLAALGPLDEQEFPEDEEAFSKWREQTPPVPLSPWLPKIPKFPSLGRLRVRRALRLPAWDALPVWLLSLDGRWTRGRVTKYGLHVTATVALQTAESLKGGMSGGPIVDAHGRLVAVVSWGGKEGACPLARLALPAWILDRSRA